MAGKKLNTRHGSYYVNVGQVIGVIGAIAVAWKFCNMLEKQGGLKLDSDTVKYVSDNVASAMRWNAIFR